MREQITTWLDLAGLVLLALASTVAVSHWSVAGGLAVGGVQLLASSALVVARAPKARHEETVG